jgi:hypothetical protein
MDKCTAILLDRIRRCALPEGTVKGESTWLRQRGEMRLDRNGPWLPFEAQEWFFGPGIEFRWQANMDSRPFLKTQVVDAFERGKGALTVSILGILPVVRARGPVVDKGEMLRGLAELPWHPLSFRETDHLKWQSCGSNKLLGSFNDGKTCATLELDIDGDGHVLGGSAVRPRKVGKSMVETMWSGIYSEYRMFQGIRIPTRAEAAWDLPEGRFCYWWGTVIEFAVLR